MNPSTHILAAEVSLPEWLSTVSTGLANGALYALLAVALVTVYRTTGHLNFAQGEFAMISAFLVFTFVGMGMPIWVAILVTMVVTAAASAALQFGVMRPLESRGHSASLIAVLGMFLFANSFAGVVWGVDNKTPLAPFPDGTEDRLTIIGGDRPFTLSFVTLGVWGALIALLIVLWILLSKTKLGVAYRAVISNRSSAALVGIPVAGVFAFGWALAAVPGTLAGALTSQATSTLNFSMMINVLIFAFTAACVGGFDSLVGAVVGGLLVGVVESVVPRLFPAIGTGSGLMIALVLLLVVLVIRPQGMFGQKEVTRV
ncbi:branched-chain amino acid ABC transporter permease [Rhodococcus sp. HM1]|uniref:branched-chain amino acid ABC transporter permease n=1 Tax=unclassified Rhodococcus (in: high G+C Gram-positive bacteria) TaxID=192944 RepID=UPI0018CD753F|nr:MULTISPECIES: branched-chain amino acid ABC transporter permease [unclassified Rhodococcus (in: high G+C Gram-positive bacteria)]MBH0119777.1 branched-chain amino acid ABC transporter permease [Rhodococcus sp. CX]MCK8672803.1 branched-chain amino acid ABC transporter permease [Rhodococcus sp. HM1]